MAVSVRMDPLLERDLERAARLAGVSKSQFIIGAVERALGRKHPYELLMQVEREFGLGAAAAPSGRKSAGSAAGEEPTHGERLQRILREKHDAEVRDWQAWQAGQAHADLKAAEPTPAERRAAPRRRAKR